MIFAVLYL